jgi:outer membrane receptor protein involved in Fe transport
MWRHLWAILPLLPVATPADENTEPISEIVVTSQRRPQSLQRHAGNIVRLDAGVLARANAQHINELLHRAAGVWIVRGSGQEHQTSMRSPVLGGAGSCGAFLVLEDGIPIRPANFCNGNQLIEVVAEQAASVEVVRGPGNALHGSNALHGIVNVLMPMPGNQSASKYVIEYGSNDYLRLRTTLPFERDAPWLGSMVLGRDGGFRDDSGYRQGKLHVKRTWAERDFSLALSATTLRQDTAGFIIGEDAYKGRALSGTNPNPEAYRDADSVRLYGNLAWQRRGIDFDVRPFLRYSSMEFLHHALPGQPVERNGQTSLGAISAATFDLDNVNVVVGADVEWSDVYLQQTQPGPATGPPRVVETRPEGKHYDFRVASLSLATFAQADYRLSSRSTITGGLRLEYAHYDYDNRMISGNTRDDGSPCGFDGCLYTRPADRTDDFLELSPNLSASISVSDIVNLYISLARGYRMPQTLELYRLQNGQQVADINPETIDSAEMGLRSNGQSLSLDLTLFAMKKRDSVFRDAIGFNVNGASSQHRGVEVDIAWQAGPQWRLSANASYARHLYDFTASGPGESFQKGNDVDTAPRLLGSAEVQFEPRDDLNFGLQLAAVGPYYLEPGNQFDYEGHVIGNFRAAISRWPGYEIVLRVNNLADTRYADRADFAAGNYRYLPGREREFFVEFSHTL